MDKMKYRTGNEFSLANPINNTTVLILLYVSKWSMHGHGLFDFSISSIIEEQGLNLDIPVENIIRYQLS